MSVGRMRKSSDPQAASEGPERFHVSAVKFPRITLAAFSPRVFSALLTPVFSVSPVISALSAPHFRGRS